MNTKSGVLLGFLVGVAVGANWPKIRKYLGPYLETAGEASAKGFHSLLGLFVSGKERVEDLLAEAQVKKTKKAKKMTKPRKKATAKRSTKATAYTLSQPEHEVALVQPFRKFA